MPQRVGFPSSVEIACTKTGSLRLRHREGCWLLLWMLRDRLGRAGGIEGASVQHGDRGKELLLLRLKRQVWGL